MKKFATSFTIDHHSILNVVAMKSNSLQVNRE